MVLDWDILYSLGLQVGQHNHCVTMSDVKRTYIHIVYVNTCKSWALFGVYLRTVNQNDLFLYVLRSIIILTGLVLILALSLLALSLLALSLYWPWLLPVPGFLVLIQKYVIFFLRIFTSGVMSSDRSIHTIIGIRECTQPIPSTLLWPKCRWIQVFSASRDLDTIIMPLWMISFGRHNR